MDAPKPSSSKPFSVVRRYHERTKHQLQRYAAGPETLDWDTQPNPFRRWAGSPLLTLPLVADSLTTRWGDLFVAGAVKPRSFSLQSIAALLELSLGLTAWKQYGPDRWALRANPSSGNLHPTEAYVLAQGVAAMPDGLYHYAPKAHALEQRQAWPAAGGEPCLWIGLSSIQWREAWKYGERAFRYCQLDTGHAVGAIRYAAASLGWQARVVENLGQVQLAAILGLDRDADFGPAEREEPELMIQIRPGLGDSALVPLVAGSGVGWQGTPNRLDRHPMYRWPVIDEVALASREPDKSAAVESLRVLNDRAADAIQASARHDERAATLIRQRRSAQHFDRRASMPVEALFRMLLGLMPSRGLPWDAWPHPCRVHPILFLHRVDGLEAGAYVLPRSESGHAMLSDALLSGQAWSPVNEAGPGLPFYKLVANPSLAGTMRTLSCHQAIASDACFTLAMLAEFDAPMEGEPWRYRQLYQEAGLLGQMLYMQAEAEGYRGTGIGCYFDDAVHDLLGLKGTALQSLYHFTVGVAQVDSRLTMEPPYPDHAFTSELD